MTHRIGRTNKCSIPMARVRGDVPQVAGRAVTIRALIRARIWEMN